MTHNFERLKAHILPLSCSQDFNQAKKEWDLISIEISKEYDFCPCGKEIKEHCYIKNKRTGHTTYVGNVCVNRFIGIKTNSLFAGLKRIAEDNTKSPSEALILYAYNSGYLYEGEYEFLMAVRLKKTLSANQIAWRRKINRRILNQIVVQKRNHQST
ncbi:hypothetical protein DOP62_14155 (plasmid) [Synechococcus elongatus PCC 11801]|uniref:Uncharacterized protein n=1 Tax=Synechococcus elongatus PCC 11801 TaxID=2219813 RepID=A0ACD5A3H1_SYNEL